MPVSLAPKRLTGISSTSAPQAERQERLSRVVLLPIRQAGNAPFAKLSSCFFDNPVC
jgi:hypothetical protein